MTLAAIIDSDDLGLILIFCIGAALWNLAGRVWRKW